MPVGIRGIAFFAILPLAVGSVSGRVACHGGSFFGAAFEQTSEASPKPAPPKTTEVTRRSVKDAVKITGTLKASSRMLVTAEEAAVVARVQAREGQEVRRGDVLATLDVRPQKPQKGQSRQKAQLNQAVPVKAPISGSISEILVEPGQSVEAGASLVSIVDMSSAEIQALVPARDAVRIRRGMHSVVQIEGFGAHEFTGRVDRIAPEALGDDRFIRVWISLATVDADLDPKLTLRGGVSVFGEIVINRMDDVPVLPATAVRSDREGDFVHGLENGETRRLRVTVGPYWEDGEMIQIEGVEPGTKVLINPPRPVTPEPEHAPKP